MAIAGWALSLGLWGMGLMSEASAQESYYLSSATYLGGSKWDMIRGLCTDPQGNLYVTGGTSSTNFPTTDGTKLKSAQNCFLTKFRPDGANLVFSTIVGGTGSEYNQTHNVAVDAQDNIYVEFSTTSTDLPVTAGCVQPSYGGGGDMGLAVYSPTGSLLACTYLGGSGFENMDGLSVDAAGNVLVTAGTPSANFPVTNAFQAVNGGGNDVVLARLSSDLRSLLYSASPVWGRTVRYASRANPSDRAGPPKMPGKRISAALRASTTGSSPGLRPTSRRGSPRSPGTRTTCRSPGAQTEG